MPPTDEHANSGVVSNTCPSIPASYRQDNYSPRGARFSTKNDERPAFHGRTTLDNPLPVFHLPTQEGC